MAEGAGSGGDLKSSSGKVAYWTCMRLNTAYVRLNNRSTFYIQEAV